MSYSGTGEILIIIWFAVSVLIAVVGTFVFWLWLVRRGVKLTFMWTGTPGYLEYAYVKWCRSEGRPLNRGVIVFRAVSIINVVIAAAFFIAFAAQESKSLPNNPVRFTDPLGADEEEGGGVKDGVTEPELEHAVTESVASHITGEILAKLGFHTLGEALPVAGETIEGAQIGAEGILTVNKYIDDQRRATEQIFQGEQQ